MNEINLKDYGYTDPFITHANALDVTLTPARITAVYQNSYDIVCEYGHGSAKLKGSFSYNTVDSADFPTVGDFVLVHYQPQDTVLIEHVLPRKSTLSRKAPNDRDKLTQLIAANVDYAFIVMSLNDDFNTSRAERYLTAIYQGGITPVIVLSKCDLCDDLANYLYDIEQVAIGVDIITCSSLTDEGIDAFHSYLQPEKTVVFVGSSGVGKSSLLNKLANKDIMAVKTIREDDSKGRHTTTHRQLIQLDNGSMIIDTPGMREFGLIDMNEGLDHTFSDIQQLSEKCKFSDCSHHREPGCAVQTAIQSGELPLERFTEYQKLLRANAYYDNKAKYVATKDKAISKHIKQMKKDRKHKHR